jgi:hypothetical protein
MQGIYSCIKIIQNLKLYNKIYLKNKLFVRKMKIIKSIKDELMSKEFWMFFLITVIIFGGSYVFIDISTNYFIEKETFYWFTSTVTQTFGALLGLFIVIAIFKYGQMSEYIRNMIPEVANPEQVPKPKLWSTIYIPIQSILILIAISLFAMILTENLNPKGITWLSIAIIFYSLYCLILLIGKISEYFS